MVLLQVIFLSGFNSFKAHGQSYPSGFSQVKVANVNYPTSMAVAPDGRIFVGEKAGRIRIIKNGVIQSTTSPFLRLNVSTESERGIGGIAIDPNFSSNGYVYVYYTTASSPVHNRLSRFTANGDYAGSETVLIDFEPVQNTIHNGGGMAFGPDGKLYLAMGDDKVSANAQDLTTHKGKVLRLNRDGTTPSSNPFYSSSNPVTRRIWALGLRNPYTLSIQPGTGKIFVNDVGEGKWEEINDATAPGKNFGWPAVEGPSSNSAYTNPVYAYNHWSSGSDDGCAIAGGTFFNPSSTNYPAQYVGKYFFMDYCGGWINYLNLSSSVSKTNFATGVGSSLVVLAVGTDGNIYFFSISSGAIYKIVYNNNNAPVITSHPSSQTVPAGQPASFSVSASGTQPLSYQWQKNGVNIPGATSATYSITATQSSHAGQYRAVVTNSYGTATSNSATLTVTAYNAQPVATISAPVNNSLYNAGQVINFSGNATDAEDGTLPASAFKWTVVFHHDAHSHPGPAVPQGVKSGSFTIPTSGEVSANVWYRIHLEVTDNDGLTGSTYVDVKPRTSTITLASQPPGLQLTYDGQPKATPHSVEAVEGMQIPIGVVSPQTMNGNTYVFDHWSHGGNASQTVTIPASDVTYTAVFKVDTTAPPVDMVLVSAGSSWKYLDNGSNQGTAWRNISFNDGTWKTGNAELGYGDGDEATTVSYGSSSSAKHVTTYFRKSFTVTDKTAFSALKLELIRDDGAVVYINGQEVYRNNMPSGSIAYNTYASVTADGASESTFLIKNLGASALVNGTNVIAVEIHQAYAHSSDISFNLKLTGIAATGGGGGGGTQEPELIAAGSSWKYLDNGSNQGTIWRSLSFNDGTWKTGNAEMGYGDGDEATVVSYGSSSSAKHVTTYFRKTFSITDKTAFSALKLELVRDDGAVVYINGQEVYRNNMPSGAIAYNTYASVTADGASESTFLTATLGTSALVNGTNVIAVEIHQAYAQSSDISFNLKLKGVTSGGGGGGTEDPQFINAGAQWKYLDNGSNQGTSWREAGFNDGAWKTGYAELGYGDGNEATVVSYGGNSTQKYPTTYFRKSFDVPDASQYNALLLELKKDDGAVVYLNGNEIYRVNMPAGEISYNTYASAVVDGAAESAFTPVTLSSQYLVSGTNVIAVEIHQGYSHSSDISFDLKLKGVNSARLDQPEAQDGIAGPDGETDDVFVNIFPNPSNGEFNIQYNIAQDASTMLEVYDALGKRVHVLSAQARQTANEYRFTFSPAQLGLDSEVYFIKLTVDDKTYMTKLLYMK